MRFLGCVIDCGPDCEPESFKLVSAGHHPPKTWILAFSTMSETTKGFRSVLFAVRLVLWISAVIVMGLTAWTVTRLKGYRTIFTLVVVSTRFLYCLNRTDFTRRYSLRHSTFPLSLPHACIAIGDICFRLTLYSMRCKSDYSPGSDLASVIVKLMLQ